MRAMRGDCIQAAQIGRPGPPSRKREWRKFHLKSTVDTIDMATKAGQRIIRSSLGCSNPARGRRRTPAQWIAWPRSGVGVDRISAVVNSNILELLGTGGHASGRDLNSSDARDASKADVPFERAWIASWLAAVAALFLMVAVPRQAVHLPPQTSIAAIHLLLEMFAVTIASMIAATWWNVMGVAARPQRYGVPAGDHGAARPRANNLQIAGFLAVAVCDTLHALSFEGMPAFLAPSSNERAIYYWLMGRAMEAITLGLFASGWNPRISRMGALILGAAASALVLWAGGIQQSYLPQTFIVGSGVTPFKAACEDTLCAADVIIALVLWRKSRSTGDFRYLLVGTAAWMLGVGELMFTRYVEFADFQTLFGHVFKVCAYALLYCASFKSSVRAPFDALQIAEERARESESVLAAVIDSASDAVIGTDIRGRIVLFNAAAERIFGCSAAAAHGQSIAPLLPDCPGHMREHLQNDVRNLPLDRGASIGRIRGRRFDGTELALEGSIATVTIMEKRVIAAVLHDVTDRVKVEFAAETNRRELADLAHRLMAQEKDTKSRLAQVLHDHVVQTLAAMRIHFVGEATFSSAAQADRHRRVEELILQAIDQVREVIMDLRPSLLDEFGLFDALDCELQAAKRDAGEVQLHLDAPPAIVDQRWQSDVEYAAFMVAREAIANAILHARARTVGVVLSGSSRALQLRVADDGVGFDYSRRIARPGHLGLISMRERATAIGARLEVESRQGVGTTVCLSWEGGAP